MTEMVERKNGRKHGEVFTNKNVVQYILDEAGYMQENNLKNIKILEPASGKGAFASEILNRLYQSSIKYNFSFKDSLVENVRFIEVDINVFKELKTKIIHLLENFNVQNNNIGSAICINEDYLAFQFFEKYDCIVGNPPYIRHELISVENKELYRKKFETFKFRADLYIPFFEKSLKLLKTNGILSFICSNRWLNNQYGKGLRDLITRKYNLKKLLNIEKSSPFDEDVTAYPCITTIENRIRQGVTLYFEDNSKLINFGNITFNEIESPKNSSWQNLFLSYDINNKALVGIEEQGFEIGIGVATGADKIFIKTKSELNGIEQDRLLPIITSKDLKNNKVSWKERYLINPYEKNELCDLDKYPQLKIYLNENKTKLLRRHTALKTPDKWYKTIDKIKLELQKKAKILLPDLTGNKILFIDDGKYYPHHNLYYITGQDITLLKILASILMSDFVRQQISKIGIRMNGGLPRFQSQVLKKIKIPNIKLINRNNISALVDAYEKRELRKINSIIDAFCIQNGVNKIAKRDIYSFEPVQLSFCDRPR
jgi:adenine-specific DNA methylase